MPTIKLTERAVARLRAPDPSRKQRLHWDKDLRGFGVLCSGVTNAKAYVVQQALRGGKTRRVTIARTNVITLDEATQRAKEILAAFYQGVDPKITRRGDPTLRSALSGYLATHTNLKPRSAESYRDSIQRYLSAWLDLPLRDITREMVEDRLRQIAREVAAKGQHSGNATANGAMRALRVMYNFAAERQPMPPCPVRLKKIWLPVAARTRMVPADDMPKFYAATCALTNTVARDYLLLLLFTGLRRREAAALQWSEVDLVKRVIRLSAARTKAGRKFDLPMSDFVHDLLVARRAIGDAKWVFPSNSKSGHIEEPKFPLRAIAKATGINVSAHDMRRTFITVAESTEMSVLALKALVNHSLGKDVTEGYVQMTVERLRGSAQRVCDRLKELCGITAPEGVVRFG